MGTRRSPRRRRRLRRDCCRLMRPRARTRGATRPHTVSPPACMYTSSLGTFIDIAAPISPVASRTQIVVVLVVARGGSHNVKHVTGQPAEGTHHSSQPVRLFARFDVSDHNHFHTLRHRPCSRHCEQQRQGHRAAERSAPLPPRRWRAGTQAVLADTSTLRQEKLRRRPRRRRRRSFRTAQPARR